MSIKVYGEYDGVYVRDHKQLVDVLRIPSNVHSKPPRVFEVGLQAKRAMVKPSTKIYAEGERIMKALKTVDCKMSIQFGLKKLAVENFIFRLLQDNLDVGIDSAVDEEACDFMILSYACHSSWWTPHDCLKHPSPLEEDKECPLTPVMWNAFLKQRLSPTEPYWVDSLCITQTLGHEKSFAIGAMDYVYRAARKVIVVLEDIAISKSGMDAILRYAETNKPTHLRDDSDLKEIGQAYGMILKARWFQRAWCLHEFNTSNKHVFLVPVSQSHEVQMTQDLETTMVLRIDAPFLNTISRVYVLQDIESQRLGLSSLINTPSMKNEEIQNIHRFMKRLSALNMAEVFGTEDVHTDGSYMHMYTEIFSLGAFLTADKMSVLLNVMDSGLFYQAEKELTKEQSFLLITTIALAAGDVTALTANGRPLSQLGVGQATKYGWIRMPSGDQARPLGAPTIPRSSVDSMLTERGLEIDLEFIPNENVLIAAEQRYQSLARLLIDHRAMTQTPISDPALWLDFETDEKIYTQVRLYYIQTLACMLQCGIEWMVDCRSRLGASLPGIDFGLGDDVRQNLEDAVDWAFSIDLENDIGPDIREMWGDDTKDEGEENDSISSDHGKHVYDYDEDLDSGTTYTAQETQNWHKTLLKLVDELIVTGLAISYDSERGEENVPYSIQIYKEPPHGSPFLVFVPEWTSERRHHLCVPKCLLPESYSWMSRLWILEPLEAPDREYRTTLAGADDSVGSSSVPRVAGDTEASRPRVKSYALQAKTRLVGITSAPRGEMRRALIAK